MISSISNYLFKADDGLEGLQFSPRKTSAVSFVAVSVVLAVLAGLFAGRVLSGDELIANWSAVGLSVATLALMLAGVYLFNLKKNEEIQFQDL